MNFKFLSALLISIIFETTAYAQSESLIYFSCSATQTNKTVAVLGYQSEKKAICINSWIYPRTKKEDGHYSLACNPNFNGALQTYSMELTINNEKFQIDLDLKNKEYRQTKTTKGKAKTIKQPIDCK